MFSKTNALDMRQRRSRFPRTDVRNKCLRHASAPTPLFEYRCSRKTHASDMRQRRSRFPSTRCSRRSAPTHVR
ncbi:hypothetical protein [Choristoneura occidentalis alphabaculovirus]|nr:hypothetical protein [Choristoneura occidentalis alphabaculovirus]